MLLYSGTTCPFSHRCRFLLNEKGMDFEVRDVDVHHVPEDIFAINPYGEVPILAEPASAIDAVRTRGTCSCSFVHAQFRS